MLNNKNVKREKLLKYYRVIFYSLNYKRKNLDKRLLYFKPQVFFYLVMLFMATHLVTKLR